jgi:hypothetical protein
VREPRRKYQGIDGALLIKRLAEETDETIAEALHLEDAIKTEILKNSGAMGHYVALKRADLIEAFKGFASINVAEIDHAATLHKLQNALLHYLDAQAFLTNALVRMQSPDREQGNVDDSEEASDGADAEIEVD